MEFVQFKEELEKILLSQTEERLGGSLHFEKVLKNGGPKSGIIYRPEDGAVGITIYAEDHYAKYNSGLSINKIAEDIVDFFERESVGLDGKGFLEMFKPENIIPVLVPTKGNKELLEQIPHVPFENLQVIFKFSLPDFRGGVQPM